MAYLKEIKECDFKYKMDQKTATPIEKCPNPQTLKEYNEIYNDILYALYGSREEG
jgi:hypothetical protein